MAAEKAGLPAEIKWFAIAVVFMVVQRVSVRAFALEGWESDVRRTLFAVTTIGVGVVGVMLARKWVAAWIVVLGVAMNLLPMLSHGGLMPVSLEVLQESGIKPADESDLGKPLALSKDIVLRRDEIRFELLSDRYILSLPIIGKNIYSIGDFVLFAGLCATCGEVVLRSVRGERSTHRQLSTE